MHINYVVFNNIIRKIEIVIINMISNTVINLISHT